MDRGYNRICSWLGEKRKELKPYMKALTSNLWKSLATNNLYFCVYYRGLRKNNLQFSSSLPSSQSSSPSHRQLLLIQKSSPIRFVHWKLESSHCPPWSFSEEVQLASSLPSSQSSSPSHHQKSWIHSPFVRHFLWPTSSQWLPDGKICNKINVNLSQNVKIFKISEEYLHDNQNVVPLKTLPIIMLYL